MYPSVAEADGRVGVADNDAFNNNIIIWELDSGALQGFARELNKFRSRPPFQCAVVFFINNSL